MKTHLDLSARLDGCGDNSCVIVRPSGMATNGGCRCDESKLRRAVLAQRATIAALEQKLGRAAEALAEIAGKKGMTICGPGQDFVFGGSPVKDARKAFMLGANAANEECAAIALAAIRGGGAC